MAHIEFQPLPVTITCGECSAKWDTYVWHIVNTEANPDIARQLRQTRLFLKRCPSCGTKDLLTYRNVYHDVERRVLILGEPPRKQKLAEASLVLDRVLATGSYAATGLLGGGTGEIAEYGFRASIGRIATHPALQAEKARIFWDGFDDRVIEILKIALYGCLEGYHELYGSTSVLYDHFNPHDGLVMVLAGGDGQLPKIDAELYFSTRDYLLPLLDEAPQSYFIDRDWALSFMRSNPVFRSLPFSH